MKPVVITKKTTITTLLKFERVQKAYEFAKALSISLGADEKQFAETDAAIEEMRVKITKELSGGIVRPNVNQGHVQEGEFVIIK